MRTTGVCFVLLAIVGVCIAGGAEATASRSTPGGSAASLPAGEIVFARAASERSRPSLYVMGPDGSGVRLLVGNAAQPAVAPDGSRIAFARDDEIWVMNRDGSGQRRVTRPSGAKPSNGDYEPSWSPDGVTIYFSRFVHKGETESIYSVAADGGHLLRLTHPPRNVLHGICQYGTAASPDGRIVLYAESDCERYDEIEIAAITPLGRRARMPPFRFPTGVLASDVAWSPDGSLLAYAVWDPGQDQFMGRLGATGVYVSSIDRSRPRRIARPANSNKTSNHVSAPAWSQDGEWIAFVRNVAFPNGYQGNIWLVRRDGSGLVRLTSTSADDSNPAWLAPA